jgi:hypothetical protein
MTTLIQTLRKTKTGYGHFSISVELDGNVLMATTTNTLAIDAAFDEYYDDEDTSGLFYESREEAQMALISEILRKNEVEI